MGAEIVVRMLQHMAGKLIPFLIALCFIVAVVAGGKVHAAGECSAVVPDQFATVSANMPTENTDGSALLNLAGTTVYWGPESGNYTDNQFFALPPSMAGMAWVEMIAHQIKPNATETKFYVITASDADGNESEYSNVGSKVFIGLAVIVKPCPPMLPVIGDASAPPSAEVPN